MIDGLRHFLHVGDTSLLRRVWDIAFTFCLVAYGWMMFYAPDLCFIMDVSKGYFHFGMPYIHQTTVFFFSIGLVILFLKDYKDEYLKDRESSIRERHPRLAVLWHYGEFAVLTISIVWIGVLGGGQFIYFKF